MTCCLYTLGLKAAISVVKRDTSPEIAHKEAAAAVVEEVSSKVKCGDMENNTKVIMER